MREILRKFIKETGIAPLISLEMMKKAEWNYEKAMKLSKEYIRQYIRLSP